MANLGIPGENTGFMNGKDSTTQNYGGTGLKPKRILRILIILVVLLLGNSVIIYWFAGGFDPAPNPPENPGQPDIKYKSVTLEDVLNDLEVEGLLDNVAALHKTFKDENEFNKLYTKYKNIFDKNYEEDEDSRRKKIFKRNLVKVAEHNSRFEENETTYTMEVNLFTDMNYLEVVSKYTGLLLPEINNSSSIFRKQKMSKRDSNPVPETVDWTKYTTRVKNQRECGCCLLFATAACFELYYAYTNQVDPVNMSVEELLCCARPDIDDMKYEGNFGCNGTSPNSTAVGNYIQEHGLSYEADYPYRGLNGSCGDYYNPPVCERDNKTHLTSESFKGVTFSDYEGNENKLKETIANHGPTVVVILMNRNMFNYGDKYKYNLKNPRENVYSTPCDGNQNIGHAVLAVGYGNEGGIDYWLLKNSYGYWWGDKGYFKIQRNIQLCGIASLVGNCFDTEINKDNLKPYKASLADIILD